jgi:hypothetical protein
MALAGGFWLLISRDNRPPKFEAAIALKKIKKPIKKVAANECPGIIVARFVRQLQWICAPK